MKNTIYMQEDMGQNRIIRYGRVRVLRLLHMSSRERP